MLVAFGLDLTGDSTPIFLSIEMCKRGGTNDSERLSRTFVNFVVENGCDTPFRKLSRNLRAENCLESKKRRI